MAITKTQVSQLYVSIFGRASEGEGNTFWQTSETTTTAADGMFAQQVVLDYFNVTDFTSEENVRTVVETIYLNALGKVPADDVDGINFWVNSVIVDGDSIGKMAADLTFAATTLANAGPAQDTFNNKVSVSNSSADSIETFTDFDQFQGYIAGVDDTQESVDAAESVISADADSIVVVPPVGEEGQALRLTTDADDLVGTAGDDTFTAHIFDNQNTAQSGDMVDGGAGTDSLFADIGTSQNFAITLDTTSVENFAVRAQAAGFNDSPDNNMNDNVQIDAERMVGTTRYESNNSRADVVIEDVRIEDSEITKDITVAMVQTDPGDVDFGVYFDQHSLRAASASAEGAVFNLEIMDTRSADAGLDPLLENPFNGFTFKLGGVDFSLASPEFDAATTYAELLSAVQAQLLVTVGLEDTVTAAISGTFQATDTDSSNPLIGQTITLTNAGPEKFETGSWTTADGTLPAGGGLHRDQDTLPPSETSNLITSTVILDDVGRGSMGGDLVIGGLSIGNESTFGTSDSTGVEQFNITVERSSELQTINSTQNTLEEVYIVNGTEKGDLTVTGDVNPVGTWNDLVGDDDQDNWAGFSDVRILDASAMEGSLTATAELTAAVADKYMNSVDTATDATADNIDFIYTLGTVNDSLELAIDSANLAAAGTTTREDFSLVVNGANGDDTITTAILDANGDFADSAGNWYDNSQTNANLIVNGDAGNDTINTIGAGDFVINAGSDDDVVYSDNNGEQTIITDTVTGTTAQSKATWVINTDNVSDIADLVGNGVGANSLLYKSSLLVTYSGANVSGTSGVTAGAASKFANGFESKVTIGTNGFIGNTSNVNQAIKDAINNDAVLNKLLVATDGPASSLVITSLIDGTFNPADLDINVVAYQATAAELTNGSTLDTAWELLNSDSTMTVVQGDLNAAVAAVNTALGTDLTQLATDDFGSDIAGMDSVLESNNVITLGTGNDLAVLGTEANSNDTLVFAGLFGNDTVVNFDDSALASADMLDFTSYLGGLETIPAGSTSTESKTVIATASLAGTFAGANAIEANQVYVINDFVKDAAPSTETWNNLTDSALLAAINSTTNTGGANDYSNISAGDFTVGDTNADLVGTVIKSVFMVENDFNDGEYKVFEVTATGGVTDEFSAVDLVGIIDFGASLDATTLSLV